MSNRPNVSSRMRTRCHAAALAAVCLALAVPATGIAADAHRAVQAKPGEIVMLRNVSTRPAYRQAPPGMALIVNPSPKHEIDGALGTGELSDADYASLDASPGAGQAHATTVEHMVGNALGGTLGTGAAGRNDVASNGMSQAMAGPMGAVGGTTRGIGNQVQGALSALPGMTALPAAGH